MHAADILAGVHGVPVAPAGRDHQAFHVAWECAVCSRTKLRNRGSPSRPGVAIASSSGPAPRRPPTRLIRIRAGTSLPAQVSRSYGEPQSSGAAQ